VGYLSYFFAGLGFFGWIPNGEFYILACGDVLLFSILSNFVLGYSYMP
jgi:hypothetical protein